MHIAVGICKDRAVAIGERAGGEHAAGVEIIVGRKGGPFAAVDGKADEIDAESREQDRRHDERRHGAVCDFIHLRASFSGFGVVTMKLPPRRVSAALI